MKQTELDEVVTKKSMTGIFHFLPEIRDSPSDAGGWLTVMLLNDRPVWDQMVGLRQIRSSGLKSRCAAERCWALVRVLVVNGHRWTGVG